MANKPKIRAGVVARCPKCKEVKGILIRCPKCDKKFCEFCLAEHKC